MLPISLPALCLALQTGSVTIFEDSLAMQTVTSAQFKAI